MDFPNVAGGGHAAEPVVAKEEVQEVAAAEAKLAAGKEEVAAAEAKLAAAQAAGEAKLEDALAKWLAAGSDENVREIRWFQVQRAKEAAMAAQEAAQEAVKAAQEAAQEAVKAAQEAVKAAQEAVRTAQSHLRACIERADQLADLMVATKRRRMSAPNLADAERQARADFIAFSNIDLDPEDLTVNAIIQYLRRPFADVLARVRKQFDGPPHMYVSDEILALVRQDDPTNAGAYAAKEGCCSMSPWGLAFLAMTPCLGSGEASIHSLVDGILNRPLLWGLSANIGRDSHATGTIARTRRDYSAAVPVGSGVFTVLQGEEKTVEQYEAGDNDRDPVQQLTTRIPWQWWSTFFGSAELTLSFTVLASRHSMMLQFGALVRDSQRFVPLHDALDLLQRGGRFAAFHIVVRLLPHMRRLAAIASEAKALPLKWTRGERTHGTMEVSLSLQVDNGVPSVEKRWCGAAETWFLGLRRIYDVLRCADSSMHHFHKWIGWRVGERSQRATFIPFGDATWSKGAMGLVALAHVFQAVSLMHSLNIVHRDLRWANVIWNRGNDRFILIDFDDAVLLAGGQRAPAASRLILASGSHAPSCFTGEHSFEVDVWSLGLLMREVAAELEAPLSNLLGQLSARVQQNYQALSLAEVLREFEGIAGTSSDAGG